MSAVHEAMIAVLGELPAIGKNQRNQQQGFNFRGIDDVLNALNPVLAKYGLYYVPTVLERVAAQRTTAKGGVMYEVNLHVQYTFYANDGSSITASGWGEGTDSGDKATSKAMTMAMKYVLFQVFAISTEEASYSDGDSHTPPETTGRTNQPTIDLDAEAQAAGWASRQEWVDTHAQLSANLKGTPLGDTMKAFSDERGFGWPMTRDQFDQFMTFLEAAKAQAEIGSLDDVPAQPQKIAKKAAAKKVAK